MATSPADAEEVNRLLQEEGLSYSGEYRVRHLLQVLHQEVGVDEIKKHVTTAYHGLNVAVHYGCHALRPSKVTSFDNPLCPHHLRKPGGGNRRQMRGLGTQAGMLR